MPGESRFKIISVTGAHSQVGKTTVASILLNHMNNFGAIKYTKTALVTSVTDEPAAILERNKDTAILSAAGAEKVFWIQSPASSLQDVLHATLRKMTGLSGVVVEGNSPSDFLNPHLRIFIIGEDGAVKPSARMLSRKADIIIINGKRRSAPAHIADDLLPDKADVFTIDLLNKTGDIKQFVQCVKTAVGYDMGTGRCPGT